jgi:hypothetical protein
MNTKVKHTIGYILVICLVAFYTGNAEAATNDDRFLQIGMTPQLMFSPSEFCERDSDVIGCSIGLVSLGGQADIHYRFFNQRIGLGAVGGFQIERNDAQTCSSNTGCTDVENGVMGRIAAAARFYPVLKRRFQLYLVLEGGIAFAGKQFEKEAAPSFGGGIGFDLALGKRRIVLLGMDLRVLGQLFGPNNYMPQNGAGIDLANSVWISLSLLKLSILFK